MAVVLGITIRVGIKLHSAARGPARIRRLQRQRPLARSLAQGCPDRQGHSANGPVERVPLLGLLAHALTTMSATSNAPRERGRRTPPHAAAPVSVVPTEGMRPKSTERGPRDWRFMRRLCKADREIRASSPKARRSHNMQRRLFERAGTLIMEVKIGGRLNVALLERRASD